MDRWNGARFTGSGAYESWFLRANAPDGASAFWIRYTLFAPHGGGRAAGELWAVIFQRTADGGWRVRPFKSVFPIARCRYAPDGLDVTLGEATLSAEGAVGATEGPDGTIRWSLSMEGGERPLLLLSERLYAGPFPKAKALVPRPFVRFGGKFEIGDEVLDVDGWVGSQNHNWGSQHTDEYAWGQVVGFDDAPRTFLELSTARVRVGGVRTPWLTPIVLREGDREWRASGIVQAVRNSGRYDTRSLEWRFSAAAHGRRVSGIMLAPRDAFVALPYANPPGGTKTCLNSKVATCELRIEERGQIRTLRSEHGAAFEILTERTDHGVKVADVPDPRAL